MQSSVVPRTTFRSQGVLKDMPPARNENDATEARVISLVTDLGNTVLTKRAIGELHR